MSISIFGSRSSLKGAIATRSGRRIERPLIAAMWMLLFAALLLAVTSAVSADVDRQIVFERAVYPFDTSSSLWIVNRDGSNMHKLVDDAGRPAWSPVAIPAPVVYDRFVFLPLVRKP